MYLGYLSHGVTDADGKTFWGAGWQFIQITGEPLDKRTPLVHQPITPGRQAARRQLLQGMHYKETQ
jgi:hypothetical protein